MHVDLADQSVLITGGTRGIGRALVDAFAQTGARVAFTYRSSADTADAIVDELAAEVDELAAEAAWRRWPCRAMWPTSTARRTP